MADEASPLHVFGRLVREAREALGWRQKDLAERSGVSEETVKRYENAKSNPDADRVIAIARVLRLDPREVLLVLGYPKEELDLPPRDAGLPVDPILTRAAKLLADPKIPDRAKQALRKGIDAAIELWFDAFGARRPPKELSAEQRASKRAAAGK